ncbi:hypothetical protein TraAM80_05191 [Trypanosoma rangeli]|uniref:FHA domain-containing protein n=1 Tax=Trypanosoma rangeli TaxID=5698 RepID=A0A422NG15_TRYRA|nr:uncharacterized protein TraAM80_05191 [Trypanosoma rangeli]RNF04411.1 hypothetical protein TraAM80_05191 [Trypanosoma rangeli]|eukprot:RNF04411.1 hypothetical protein TraAM80_05191 [Trypanosoma rangeli]
MVGTDCYFAASEACNAYQAGTKNLRYYGENETIFASIMKEQAKSTLVFALVDDSESGKALSKAFCSHFAMHFLVPMGAYTRFTLSFIDEAAGDILNYRCDRLSDIEAIIEEEGGRHRCCSIQASVVEPTSRSFAFSNVRLTLMLWTKAAHKGNLSRAAEHVGIVLGTRITSVCVFFASRCSSFLDRGLVLAQDLCRTCRNTVFGEDAKMNLQACLEDARAWSLFLNEFCHFAPQSEGPYLINLNPQLSVGEKLAHIISKGVSYILAEKGNAGRADIVVFPLHETENGARHRSIYSPHCRVKYDDNTVFLRPECGMTYVNGELLSAERALRHNDRIILGREMIFRFVMVSASPPMTTGSRILDWETSCQEFDSVTSGLIQKAQYNQFEREVSQLKEYNERLRLQLQLERGASEGVWLVLSNPPCDYTASFVWQLGWMELGDTITLGPAGDISLSFLPTTGVLTRTKFGFTYQTDSVTLKLAHAGCFTNGDSMFSLCFVFGKSVEKSFLKKEADGMRELLPYSEDDIRQLRNSLFELQWSIAFLFDFAFPTEVSGDSGAHSDLHHAKRLQMGSDTILTNAKFDLRGVTALTGKMTEAIRMIGYQMADVVRNGVLPSMRDAKQLDVDGGAAAELLNSISTDTKLSYELLFQVHKSVGRVLVEGGDSRKGMLTQGNSPLMTEKDLEAPASSEVRKHLQRLKSQCFIASSIVVRRINVLMDSLSRSPSPKALLERHIKVLRRMVQSQSDFSKLSAPQKQSLALALVDVIFTLDYNVRNDHLSAGEEVQMESHLALWVAVGDACLEVFRPAEKEKHALSVVHDATTQRKTNPIRRHASPAARVTSKKPLSRPGTPCQVDAAPNVSPRSRRPVSNLPVELNKRTSFGGKSPCARQSSTPTGRCVHLLRKSPNVKGNLVSPRAIEHGGRRLKPDRSTATSTTYHTLGNKVLSADAAKSFIPSQPRTISPKVSWLRGSLATRAASRMKLS